MGGWQVLGAGELHMHRSPRAQGSLVQRALCNPAGAGCAGVQVLEVETFLPMLLQRQEDGVARLKRVVLIGGWRADRHCSKASRGNCSATHAHMLIL